MSHRPPDDAGRGELSRRTFLKGVGTMLVASAATPAARAAEKVEKLQGIGSPKIQGPDPVPVTLRVNGRERKLNLEPRTTLLDALRNHLGLTGTKEVCDRGTCGACTVLRDGQPIYSCMTLAIEAQGHDLTTIEGLAPRGALTDVQKAFVERDAMMCGYCTPGYVLTVTALLKNNPHPTIEQVRTACSGNLCRCGAQARVLAAALTAAGLQVADRTEVIRHA